MNDLTVVSMGHFLKIIESKSALQSNIRVFVGDYAPPSEEIVTILYPLKYLNADEIQRFLVDLVPRSGRITAYPNTNTLVMTDTGLNLRRIIAVMKAIDVPGHEDQLENIPIRYASAKQIGQLIDDILDAQSGSGPRRAGAGRGPQKTRGGGIISKIVPDERTNSLVVLANGRGVQELKSLVAKLDNPNAAGGGNIHIYYLKNAIAKDLAATLNSLISGQAKSQNGVPNAPNPLPVSPPPTLGRGGRDEGVKLEGNIKVTADDPTNSLVVVGSSSDFAALRAIVKKLDIPRRQIYVEATIMEVKASNDLTFGIGVNVAQPNIPSVGGFLPGQMGQTVQGIIAGSGAISGAVAALTMGKTVMAKVNGVNTPIPSVTGLIQAIEDSGQGQILHQPQILTSDNQEAEIKVTEKVPSANQSTSTASSTLANTTTIEKNDIVLSLKITPQIGEGGELVKLKVEQSVDDFTRVPVAGIPSISITQRKATTTVSVRDNDTIVIGGLQKSVSSDTSGKFPLLGDLPILGFLFKQTISDSSRSDLVMFLTPHVINRYEDLLKITTQKLNEREKIGATLYDPKDRQKADIQRLRKANEADLLKPPLKSWGFNARNRDSEEEDDGSTSDTPKSKKGDDSQVPADQMPTPGPVPEPIPLPLQEGAGAG